MGSNGSKEKQHDNIDHKDIADKDKDNDKNKHGRNRKSSINNVVLEEPKEEYAIDQGIWKEMENEKKISLPYIKSYTHLTKTCMRQHPITKTNMEKAKKYVTLALQENNDNDDDDEYQENVRNYMEIHNALRQYKDTLHHTYTLLKKESDSRLDKIATRFHIHVAHAHIDSNICHEEILDNTQEGTQAMQSDLYFLKQ